MRTVVAAAEAAEVAGTGEEHSETVTDDEDSSFVVVDTQSDS